MDFLSSELDKKISATQDLIDSAREGQQGETKSSAGDKHETARAMAHLEQEKNARQLQQQLQLKQVLNKLPEDMSQDQVQFGSVVITNIAKYFLAIPFGKASIDNVDYFVISVNSPIGKALLGKRKGEEFSFNGISQEITNLK